MLCLSVTLGFVVGHPGIGSPSTGRILYESHMVAKRISDCTSLTVAEAGPLAQRFDVERSRGLKVRFVMSLDQRS